MRGLGQILVLTGAARADEVSAAINTVGDGAELPRHMLQAKQVTEAQIAEAVSIATGHRYVELADYAFDPEVIGLVPGNLCRRYRLIPLRLVRDQLTVGMLDPTDIIALDDIASITDLRVVPVVVAEDALMQTFERFLRSDDELTDLSEQIGGESSGGSELLFTEHLDDQDADAPIVRFVNLLITQAINDRASDIHIEPGEHRLTVRFRIDGVLHEMQRADRSIQDGVISRLKIMSSIDIAEKRVPQDGRISVLHEGRSVDLRVATLPTVWGEKIVMRILDNSSQLMSMTDLLFTDGNQERFTQAITRPHGMVLVTGPTGSGKSTTLYTALRAVANPRVNVITVEDPVEYRMHDVNQIQVNPKAGLTFATALRSILRADPDVVLVGEIRDRETAAISVEAALTGHLVLSTLHTNDAPSALTRLVEIGTEPFLVATALSAVVAQRLSRRLCQRCRVPLETDREMLVNVGMPERLIADATPYRAVGCTSCSNTGYRGRVALHEVMTVTDEIEQALVGRATGTELREIAVGQGMVPLREDGWTKVADGITTIEEILRVTV
ncbi:type II secretion system protein GspE [Microbacterium esteraromaticum]|uniref:Type II secretion system protein GspE n=1 Tax=Microbacterium esteraromaticum TaxID=57043 RepID=A0A7D8AKQ1_9MICO|nr:ATPase, T2SS/T4P/T4SS family [Microbacterium esteraromaticum]QMU96528.1 type II secretion system protein GspE [Microbacterium esteraromaticum]